MGLKRFIWRSTFTGRMIDTVKNVADEGSITGGLKRTYKEDVCEDNPLTAAIYNAGKYDGNVEGHNTASQGYETKLLELAEMFLKQREILEEQRAAYEQLLDGYEKGIKALENKVARTEEENEYLTQLLLKERQLLSLKVI